jgi:hypothetical protein
MKVPSLPGQRAKPDYMLFHWKKSNSEDFYAGSGPGQTPGKQVAKNITLIVIA